VPGGGRVWAKLVQPGLDDDLPLAEVAPDLPVGLHQLPAHRKRGGGLSLSDALLVALQEGGVVLALAAPCPAGQVLGELGLFL